MAKSNILNTVYESVQNPKVSYGHLMKTELHIHTPASHDYELIPGKKYSDLSEEEVIECSMERGLYSREFYLERSELDNEISINNLNEKYDVVFTCFKEVIAFQLIAHELYKANIRVAVISDHNNVNGYKKLQAVIVDYYLSRLKKSTNKDCIKLFLGIEISCSDHYHLIAIFDDHDYDEVHNFIGKYIHSDKEGTYISCLDMVRRVREQGGIPYIAHVNSSDWLGTNLYKKSLFGSKELNILGLTNIDKKEQIKGKLNNLHGKLAEKYCFLHEGDSHNLDEISKKNTWIKFNKLNFQSLEKAFKNHQYCIYTEKPSFNDRFVKGMYIVPNKNGFLSKKDGKSPFVIDFSRDLNCLIGGRGVGKSTVLNILETAFTLEYSTKRYLKFISQHKVIFIVFYYKENDYILRFLPQVISESGYVKDDIFLEKAFVDSVKTDEGKYTLAPHWVTLYKVFDNGRKKEFTEVNKNEKDRILESVYKKSYSINNIIERINTGNISDFIKEIILNGSIFSKSTRIISDLQLLNKNNYRKYLRSNLDNMIKIIDERKSTAQEAIDYFNSANRDSIKVLQSPKLKDPSIYLGELEIYFNESLENKNDRNVGNTYLTWDDVEKYLYDAIKEFGYLPFLKLLINKRHKEIERKILISEYISDTTNGEYEYIDSGNSTKIYNKIEWRIFRNIDNVTRSISNLLYVVDEFTLLFNINSKESVSTEQVLMKNIEELSLGQKVVAILTFLFNYGEYSNDSTPLVIDQPEDNLDNLYIYQNLVKSLRRIKNKRQVIISTHSATIVTNADAEQVIILESDNKRGWLLKKGYPDDAVVLSHIVAILEGGRESFTHKKETYKTVLNL